MTATSQQSWLTIISGTGSANGKIIYTVTANASVALMPRVDTIVISGTGITTLNAVKIAKVGLPLIGAGIIGHQL